MLQYFRTQNDIFNLVLKMNKEQTTQNHFFDTCFEEIPFLKSVSNYSMFDNCQMDLDLNLEIEDIADFGHEDLQNYQLHFNHNPSFILDESPLFFNLENTISDVETQKHEIKNDEINPVDHLAKDRIIDNISHKNKKTSENIKKQKPVKTFYEKNICRNIIRKVIRIIESKTYSKQLMEFCDNNEQFYNRFCDIMSSHLELLTGPAALSKFIEVQDAVSLVMRKFSRWYLKERYIRDAMSGGQMSNLNKYISYKNNVLLPMLDRV